ncbi:MAG: lipopolysaccharide biosynthesis protein [Clostridia bacterium]|nr:lipopolysaccharide biosynthesis protein [Clostridia bacterium]
MNDNEIVIVTAFFDIDRKNFNNLNQKRSNKKYFDYFKFWSKIQNTLIIYCDPENVDIIKQIRGTNLLDKTIVIPINIEKIEPQLLDKMKNVEQDKRFQELRHHKNDISNTALYNYIMLLKWWCVQDASERLQYDCAIAWIDFGFNHGDSFYLDSNDFNFLWQYNYPEEKLNAFCLNDPSKVSLLDSLIYQFDCFTGTFVIPSNRAFEFWTYIKDAMSSLVDIGCIDDDQFLMLMVYKKHPEIFNIQISNWFDIFRLNSNKEFKTRTSPTPTLLTRIKNKLYRTIKIIKNFFIKSAFVKLIEKIEIEHFDYQ